MNANARLSLADRIDQQITRLDLLSEQTLANYKKTSITVPAHMLDDFKQLTSELAALRAQAERLERSNAFTAIGDSVNTAKRIQENALANQILISSEAYAQVARQVNARPAGAIQLKGKSKPVLVYEVLGLR